MSLIKNSPTPESLVRTSVLTQEQHNNLSKAHAIVALINDAVGLGSSQHNAICGAAWAAEDLLDELLANHIIAPTDAPN
jgi:hypothetical protein